MPARNDSQPLRQAVILVGGLGTRLGELTKSTPKPLLPVAGRPFLDYVLFDLARQGINSVLLAARFQAPQIDRYIADSEAIKRFGLDVSVSVEPKPAGTGGALFHLREQLDERFLVLNGDSVIDVNVLALAQAAPDALGTLTVYPVPDASRYGTIEVNDGRLAVFNSRPNAAGPGLVNGGVYVFNKAILNHLKPECSLEQDIFPNLAASGELAAFKTSGFFLDIGVPESYAFAQTALPQRQRKPAVFFDRDGVLNLDHGHVGTADRFEWTAGARETIRLLNDTGHYVFVATNQAGVAKGKYAEVDVLAVHQHMQRELAEMGAHIDDFRYCPFHPDAVVEVYRRISDWRKPQPGMLLDLMEKWPVDASRSVLIGDQSTDIEAASAAGLKGLRFMGDDLLRFWQSIQNEQKGRNSHEWAR
jgi:D,D-heptose 1,7-bisphosphate phosphatase